MMTQLQPDRRLREIPGIKFVDHVAIAVKQGDLDNQVKAYEMLGFREIHREEVRGTDQVREALLQIGDGPNLIQLLEPLSCGFAGAKDRRQERRPARGGACRLSRGERAARIRCDAEQRIQNHRRGATAGLARNDGLFRSSQVAGRQSLRHVVRNRRSRREQVTAMVNSSFGVPARKHRDMGTRDSRGPEGRGLCRETDLALAGRD